MRHNLKRFVFGLMGVGALLVVAACGSSSGGRETGTTATQATGPAQEVKVAMGDFFYDPGDITVKGGKVRFVLTNVGATAHRFAVRGNEGFDASSKNVGAGREGVLEVDLRPGIYKLGCTLGDHEKRGSVGKITVQ